VAGVRRVAAQLGTAVNRWVPRTVAAGCGLVALSLPLAAQERAPIEVSAALGAALPVGELEAGSSLRDVSFGTASLAVALSYLRDRWGATVWASYAASVPTLCGSSSECVASLGHDVTLGLSSRYDAPRVWKLWPTISAGLGYEWFTSKLSDGGATSSRSFHGIVIPVLEAYGGFNVGRRWRVGPFLCLSAGRFNGGTVRGPAGDEAPLVSEPRWHGWVEIGFRTSVRP
jgi:hypothetical protein